MRLVYTFCFLFVLVYAAQAQHTFKAIVKNEATKEPLPGTTVVVKAIHQSTVADSSGVVVLTNLPAGTYTFSFSFVGFEAQSEVVAIPQTMEFLEVLLKPEEEHEEEKVIVMATRTSRTISNTPTRVEVISGEELEEKGNMKPGDIRMLLNESTGIQTQQTSATSYNSSIRIQGLDGRYTQLLRDGLPLYAGFSSGLSIMQIAPLDLQQVEVIKGSSSTLYGGGAIAGLVNLVSKTPGNEREISFMANGTNAKGLDLSSFYSKRFGKAGVTVFASRNSGSPYDPADNGLTAIPKFSRYTINPRLFLYGEKTAANAGISYITEDRLGGSMEVVKNDGTGYYEQNNSDRITTQFAVAHQLSEWASLQFKNSYSRFKRSIQIPAYLFEGVQQSSFSELSCNWKKEKAEWISGINVLTDDFSEEQHTAIPSRSYHYNTYGVFVQNTWLPTEWFTLESGLRGDYVNDFGFELLPRVAALFRITPQLTSRIGGGRGYKTPTIFNEDAERIQFQNIFPIDKDRTHNERSVGGNLDVNYSEKFGALGFSINQLFFFTRLNQPLVLTGATGGKQEYLNANGHIDTKGWETNIKLLYADFKLFVGYTYADVNSYFNNEKAWLPLTARHRLNNVLMYEKEEQWKLGLEAYYFSPQRLSDGSKGKPYWISGFMAERIWEHISVFVNFENFTDTRQTKMDTLFTGSVDNPVFRDIYAPLDGFVVNGGFKLKL